MSTRNTVCSESVGNHGISYKGYLSENSPWYGLAEFWSFESSHSVAWHSGVLLLLCCSVLGASLYSLLF